MSRHVITPICPVIFALCSFAFAQSADPMATESPQPTLQQTATGNEKTEQKTEQMQVPDPPAPDTYQQKPDEKQTMPGMATQETSHSGHAEMNMNPRDFIEEILQHGTSGTSAEPDSTPIPMLMKRKGSWMFMFHGTAWLNAQQQSSSRGYDKIFSTNWFMPMAQRKMGKSGTLTLRTMLSLEPATVSGRFYPELFQVGEIAFEKLIVDGQHPHDFFMELAALYDQKLGRNTLVSFYFAPMGDPAMGPTAYPHRASASENPMATLGHHFQDSTHIADDVITAGVTHKRVRLEASGFHGREPDENRWNLDSGKIDSWSGRLTLNPAQNWSFQYSFAHLISPEAAHPEENLHRMTSSLMYNRSFGNGNFAGTLLWGRNSTPSGEVFNGYLAEATVQFRTKNYAWTRVEMDDRSSELLFGLNTPANLQEQFIGRVKALTAGYDHEFAFIPHVATAFGGQISVYGTPDNVKAIYGSHPAGVVLFVRFRPLPGKKMVM